MSPDESDALNTTVAEMRAGMRPLPAPGEKVDPVVNALLALTHAQSMFEAELAKSLGPEDAHRIAFGNGTCSSSSQSGGRRRK